MKTLSANSKYLSTFLPIFADAETRIKSEILLAFLLMRNEFLLRARISKIVESVSNRVDIPDKSAYLNGLRATANLLIFRYYRKPMIEHKQAQIAETPFELLRGAKGSVQVKDYQKQLRKRIEQLAEQPVLAQEIGKKRISLWQKAELDVRQEHNLEMIDNLKEKGIDLCYISSHPDCSKRCERWQGELVSLTEHAPNPGKSVDSPKSSFAVRKQDGRTVYSLLDIMDCVDKYGYHNTVIAGFNCRHVLHPYTGQKPPIEYTREQVKTQREVEANIRKMEREIRRTKTQAYLLKQARDPAYKSMKEKARRMVAKYKDYCTRNGYAWEQYRISINYADDFS